MNIKCCCQYFNEKYNTSKLKNKLLSASNIRCATYYSKSRYHYQMDECQMMPNIVIWDFNEIQGIFKQQHSYVHDFEMIINSVQEQETSHLELVVNALEINARCTLDLNFVPANKQYQPVLSYAFKGTTWIYTNAKVRKMFLIQADDHCNNFAKLTLRCRRCSLIKTLAFHLNGLHF